MGQERLILLTTILLSIILLAQIYLGSAMDFRFQIILLVGLLYTARLIPWASRATGASLAELQLLITPIFVFAFLWSYLSQKAGSLLIESLSIKTTVIAILSGALLFIVSGVAYMAMAKLYSSLGWSQPKELGWFKVETAMELVALFVFLIAIVLLEEYVFRGLILSWMHAHTSALVAVLLSSILFSAYHISLFQFPATFILGIGMGILFLKTHSLDGPIIAHLTFNLIGVGHFLFSNQFR